MKSTLGRALDTVPELRGRLSEHLTVADSDDQLTEGGFTIFFVSKSIAYWSQEVLVI